MMTECVDLRQKDVGLKNKTWNTKEDSKKLRMMKMKY